MTNGRAVTTSLVLLTLLVFSSVSTRTSPVATARQQPPAWNTNSTPRPAKPPCPYSVEITGPAEVGAGDIITFSADVDYSGQSALTYTWTISPAEARVVGGAGTPTINVDTNGVAGGRITATLVVVVEGSDDPACRQRAKFETRVARRMMSAPPPTPEPTLEATPEPTPPPPRPTPFRGVFRRAPASVPVHNNPPQPQPHAPAARASRVPLPEASEGSAPPPVASPAAAAAPSPEKAKDENYTLVRVFYGTDRDRTGSREAAEFYGGGHGQLELGTCDVSIPKSHQTGKLESPRWWHLEFSEDEKRDILLRKVEPLDPARFYEQYRAEIGKARSRDVFVFVHGYNVTFADSARRTAQLAYDLGFPGVPVMYSWPSQGSLGGYLIDGNNIIRTKTHLKRFISELAAQSNGARVHLIAHSMGNRVLTEAMHDIALANPAPLFSEVILTAPDIDAEYFKDEIAPAIQKVARRVTLYASSDDKALKASEEAQGGQRAGDSKPAIVIVPGVETVDASGIDTSLLGLGHSYFAETKIVLDDISLLLLEGKSPAERSLREQPGAAGKYWKLTPAAVTTGVSFLSLRSALLLAVLLAACAVGAWLALRFARRRRP